MHELSIAPQAINAYIATSTNNEKRDPVTIGAFINDAST